ncbi:MAG: PAS domain S-box protein, partial [Proteobacteria bacterium]|nr:PAS domain S-box protein [Pseudomonadota bacterium]
IIYRADANGHFTFFNPIAMKIFGYSKKDLTGKHYLELMRPDYRKDAERFYGLQFVKEIHNTYYEFPAITKDGREIWLGQNVQLIMEGDKVAGFQAVTRNITERVQAERALRESETKYRSLFENTGAATVIIEEETTIIYSQHRI